MIKTLEVLNYGHEGEVKVTMFPGREFVGEDNAGRLWTEHLDGRWYYYDKTDVERTEGPSLVAKYLP